MEAGSHALLADLGVGTSRLTPVVILPAMVEKVAHGLAASPSIALADVTELFQLVPAPMESSLPFSVGCHQRRANVWSIEAVAERTAGAAEVVGSTTRIDGGKGGAALFETSTGRFVAVASVDGLTVSEVDAVLEAGPIAIATPLALPALPDLAFLASDPVLEARVKELVRSPSPVDAVGAIGTAMRLWRAVCTLQELVQPRTSDPTHELVVWAEQLGETEKNVVERLASLRAERLYEKLDALDDDCSLEDALAVVSERDVLASVALVLFAAGKGAGLMLASDIDDIDHLALSRAAFVLPAANDFLDRVRDGDPDAWWGALH